MKCLLVIPCVNRPDLLRRAVESVSLFQSDMLVIDNSDFGLNAAEWSVPVVRPPVSLTFSQSMNLAQRLAVDRGCDVLLTMHNDGEASPGTPERLRDLVLSLNRERRNWGVVFTHYDVLAAHNVAAFEIVGPWDAVLPQYFSDNDYYRRMRLAGFELVDSGLPVLHHGQASNTLRSDPERAVRNEATFALYEQYYVRKWGGLSGSETYARPFDGAVTRLRLRQLRDDPLFAQLAATYQTVEGNLLELADERTVEAQLAAIEFAVRLARPTCILETGTQKSFFGFVLSHLLHGVTLYTFDGDPRAAAGVDLLNAAQQNVRSRFTCGDSKETLREFHQPDVALAWIDGGHDEATALSDLRHAMRLRVPLLAVDDTKIMPEVARAIEQALAEEPQYVRLMNPFANADFRGIQFLRRRE